MHEGIHLGILMIFGICVAGGMAGAWLFQKFKIPQVVGYIVMGVLLGETGFGMIHPADIVHLQPFNHFALGLIGFLVGGELHIDMFKKYGKQFAMILIGEGILAFLLVGIASSFIVWFICADWVVAIASGVVFGAIASATDPASTIDVLWEYRSAGVLSTAIIAIVALDDALAMTLYGVGTSVASILTQSGETSIIEVIGHTAVELIGALILGLSFGFILNLLVHYMPKTEKRLGISVGILLLCIGISVAFNMDVILATMAVGIVLVNRAPRRSKKLFEVIRSFSTPIYIVFFVLVGARLSLGNMPPWVWGLVATYVFMRSVGKWLGAWIGGGISKAEKTVQSYMGLALFAQGGVAVGLSIVASHSLQAIKVTETMSLGDMIIFTVTATTLCVQLIGPACAKLAIQKAGEIGRNVTEEDVISEWTVSNVVNKKITPLRENMSLREVVGYFSEQDTFVYPVISKDGSFIGIITFEMLKDVLNAQDTWQWLLVRDIMKPVRERLTESAQLSEAIQEMQNLNVEVLPVVQDIEKGILLGIIDLRMVRQLVSVELMKRQVVA